MNQPNLQGQLIEFRRCSKEVESRIRDAVLLHALQVLCEDKTLTSTDFEVLWSVGFDATATDEELREVCEGEPLLPAEVIQASLFRLEALELISTSWRAAGVKEVVATELGKNVFNQCLDYYHSFSIRWEKNGL